jgi:hypothetical protein
MPRQLEESLKKSTKTDIEDSKNWLRTKAKVASKENKARRNKRRDKLLGDESRVTNTIDSGKLYLFTYDAKLKEELPYWDKSPLTIMFDVTKDGNYLGLNFHYLPPILRAKLLDAILDLPTYKTQKQKVKMSYDIIRSFAGSPLATPCVKQYIPSHIMGNVVEIGRDEWNFIVMLPLANFASLTGSASLSRVYADSRRKIR